MFPLHEILAVGLSGDQEEKDIQMDVFVYVVSSLTVSRSITFHIIICIDLSCPPPEFYRLLDSVIKKQGIYHATDKGTGVQYTNYVYLSLHYYIFLEVCLLLNSSADGTSARVKVIAVPCKVEVYVHV